MPPKAKKGPKDLQTLAALTALQATYKAASRRHGSPVLKTIAERIEERILAVKVLDKITLTGPTVTSGTVHAVVECLAGYPFIKNLCCFGCSLGDEGLLAIAEQLKAGVDKWYKGSKLRLLEITNDGAGFPAERWPERFMGHMHGDHGAMATFGAGFEMPSLVLGSTAAATGTTVRLASMPGLKLDEADIERRFSSLFATTFQHTSVAYNQALDISADCSSTVPSSGAKPQPAFSHVALKQFSLALSAQPLALQVLSLDHNHLGDVGAKILAAGLHRCATLQQLSLAHCDIGRDGAMALANTMYPDEQPIIAILQPKYQLLNLSYNPLGASGLAALCGGLARCKSLRSVMLAGIGVTDEHLIELQALSDACAANPAVEQVDLDANFIGSHGVEIFLPMLRMSPQMRRFRITDRISREVGEQLGSILRANFPLKGRKPKVAKK